MKQTSFTFAGKEKQYTGQTAQQKVTLEKDSIRNSKTWSNVTQKLTACNKQQ